ncbi:MAG: hypothetical protein IRY92_05375 [Dactylosporangium sp.]|nr:hypothetical protein [Dactylosporangium sp.]
MASNTKQPRCAATRKDGQPCQAPALPDDRYCWAHSELVATERDEARRRGGRNRAALVRLRQATPARLRPVFNRLEQALEKVEDGTLTPAQAQAMAALARAMVAVLETGELEERLRELEAATAQVREGAQRWA